MFFNFYCFRSRELSQDHRWCQGLRAFFYFSPSVPHYGGCALTDALCAGLSLPSSRASADADFAQIYFCFSILLFSLAGVVSRSPAVPGPPRVIYFSPSVPHYGGCALPDALCANPSLPSFRASAPADFCTNYYLFFIFTFSLAKVVSRSPAVPGPPRFFYFSPSVPHYGGCALTDALYTNPSLPSSRASAPADFAQIIICFSILYSLSRRLSPDHRRCLGLRAFFISPPSVPHYGGCALTDALYTNPSLPSSRASAPADFGSNSRTCLLCWRPRGLHRATSDNCR